MWFKDIPMFISVSSSSLHWIAFKIFGSPTRFKFKSFSHWKDFIWSSRTKSNRGEFEERPHSDIISMVVVERWSTTRRLNRPDNNIPTQQQATPYSDLFPSSATWLFSLLRFKDTRIYTLFLEPKITQSKFLSVCTVRLSPAFCIDAARQVSILLISESVCFQLAHTRSRAILVEISFIGLTACEMGLRGASNFFTCFLWRTLGEGIENVIHRETY